jgi:hypothetical protein
MNPGGAAVDRDFRCWPSASHVSEEPPLLPRRMTLLIGSCVVISRVRPERAFPALHFADGEFCSCRRSHKSAGLFILILVGGRLGSLVGGCVD